MADPALYLRQLEDLQRQRAYQQHPFDPPPGPPGFHPRPAPQAGHDRPNEATYPVAVGGLSDLPFMDPGGTTACVMINFIPYHYGLCPRMGLGQIGGTGTDATSALLFPFEDGMRSHFLTVRDGKLATIGPDGAIVDTFGQPAASEALTDAYISGNAIFGQGGKIAMIMNGAKCVIYNPANANAPVSELVMGTDAGKVNGTNPAKWVSATSYRNQVFAVDGSSTAYYLPLLQVAGEVQTLQLGGVLPNAASVVMVDSWSMVAGDALSQRLCFFTDDGYVAVYSGAVSELQLQGVFSVGNLLSRNCKFQHVTDLMVGTTSGLLSMNGLISGHPEPYISTQIERLWRGRVAEFDEDDEPGWGAFKWQDRNLAFVFNGSTVMGINLESRAWFDFDYGEITPVAFAPLGNRIYMTDEDGTFYELAGGHDAKTPIECTFRMTPVAFPVNVGRVQMRSFWSGKDTVDGKPSVAADADQAIPAPAPVFDREASSGILGKGKLGQMRISIGEPAGGAITTGWEDMERSFSDGGNLNLYAPTFQATTMYSEESDAVMGGFGVRLLTARGGA